MTDSRDEFGDRMKGYEAAETTRAFDPLLPIYARIDGRSFSKFTRGLDRPFDPRMTAAMIDSAKQLVGETHARIGYTQSDEISLVWLFDAPETEPLFGGKVHKLTSVLASMAAAHFANAIATHFESEEAAGLSAMAPHFDARVFQLPSKSEAANALLWRAMDARKNAVSMATRALYSAKAMHGADQTAMRAMLTAKGVDFDSYPSSFKWGTFVRRVTYERAMTASELARIPEKHRPAADARILRSEVREIEMPEFRTVANRVEVTFDGADPVTQ
jgi:tRNA(His) guanylyltransferase